MRVLPPVLHANKCSQLLQPLRVFLVPSCFGCLSLYAAVSAADLFDNVGQTNQVGVHTRQSSLGLDLFCFKATDASRLLEDCPPILGVGLQQPFDLALFNQTVSIGANAGPSEKATDVFEASRLAIDQIFRLAAAVDASTNVDLVCVVFENSVLVFQNDGRLCRVGRTTSAGAAAALEDDIGHVLAAQALGALLAQHPFDRVNDVRFPRPVRANNHRDPGRKLESGFLGKALKATDFKCFEHAMTPLGGKCLSVARRGTSCRRRTSF